MCATKKLAPPPFSATHHQLGKVLWVISKPEEYALCAEGTIYDSIVFFFSLFLFLSRIPEADKEETMATKAHVDQRLEGPDRMEMN